MPQYRKEHDLLGALDVPAGALYGVHTVRAVENFPLAGAGGESCADSWVWGGEVGLRAD